MIFQPQGMTNEDLAVGLMANQQRIRARQILAQKDSIVAALGPDSEMMKSLLSDAGCSEDQIISAIARMKQAQMEAQR